MPAGFIYSATGDPDSPGRLPEPVAGTPASRWVAANTTQRCKISTVAAIAATSCQFNVNVVSTYGVAVGDFARIQCSAHYSRRITSITTTSVTNDTINWTGGTDDDLAGVGDITITSFVKLVIGGVASDVSGDICSSTGLYGAHFGTSLLADNHKCYATGIFAITGPSRDWHMPDWIGWPEFTLQITGMMVECVSARLVYWRSCNGKWSSDSTLVPSLDIG